MDRFYGRTLSDDRRLFAALLTNKKVQFCKSRTKSQSSTLISFELSVNWKLYMDNTLFDHLRSLVFVIFSLPLPITRKIASLTVLTVFQLFKPRVEKCNVKDNYVSLMCKNTENGSKQCIWYFSSSIVQIITFEKSCSNARPAFATFRCTGGSVIHQYAIIAQGHNPIGSTKNH